MPIKPGETEQNRKIDINTSDQPLGSERFYEKYMKYKNKYLELKTKL